MLRCVEVRPLLSFFIEKETDPTETLETRRHLDCCDACRERAEGMSRLLARCSDLEQHSPPTDVSSPVMARLRAIRDAALAGGAAAQAAKWSGLALLLGGALTALTRPESTLSGALARPISFLGTLLSGNDGGGNLIGDALPLAGRLLRGGIGTEIPGALGTDLSVSLQILATAGFIGLMIALPVAILTFWMLHGGTSGRGFPRS